MSRSGRADREAEFTDFAVACMPRLYRSAWLLCGDRHRAEDLVQDTMAKLYSRWGARIDNPAAYAQTTLTRAWVSQLRRRSTHEHPIADVPERATTADDTADTDLRLTLLGALDELEPIDRAVVVLRYFDDLTTGEIARHLQLSDGAVRNRLMRALRRLHDHLDLSPTDLTAEGVLP